MRVNTVFPGPMRPGRTGRAPPDGTGRVAGIRRRLGSRAPCMICQIGCFVEVVVPLVRLPGPSSSRAWFRRLGPLRRSWRLPHLSSGPDLASSPMSMGNFLALRRTFFRNLGISRQPLRQREDGHSGFGPVTAPGDAELERVEAEAEAAKEGVWCRPNPVPPWFWRKGEGLPRTEVVSNAAILGLTDRCAKRFRSW